MIIYSLTCKFTGSVKGPRLSSINNETAVFGELSASLHLSATTAVAYSPHTPYQSCNLNLRTRKRDEIDLLNHTHFYDQDWDLSVCPYSFVDVCKSNYIIIYN